MVRSVCAMKESSCQSRRGYGGGGDARNSVKSGKSDSQCSRTSGDEETSKATSWELKGKCAEDKEPRSQVAGKYLRVDCKTRKMEKLEDTKEHLDALEMQHGKEYEIRGYRLRAESGAHAGKGISMDDVSTKEEEKTQSRRSKVQDEVMKVLFGPSDAKTPDGERCEVVDEEECTRGVKQKGFLYRMSMWATIGFVIWALVGCRVQIGCSELFPDIHERDPVPKVIMRRRKNPS